MQPRQSDRPDHWIPALDLIRIGAAMLVMAFHLIYLASARHENAVTDLIGYGWGLRELAGPTQIGWIGVQIFFVLSGLVIAQSAERQSARSFLRSRILRIYPAAWLCSSLTLAILVILGYRHGLVWPFARAMSLFPIWSYIDGAYWTLPIELSFYSVVAVILARGRRSDLINLFVVLGAASACYWAAVGLTGATALPHDRLCKLLLLQHGCFFSLGG